ncbi:MAG: HIT domain-containing protein [Candidatus Nanoarchaeia archaeon]|nr:HIT domain-containing protein [Candidatus Nanoarchaeia archaeon]MDD5358491.1 HIT domain-containing protein [Candidatus Nanoarchaeia archaeon]MDD5589005.1 HIT domain-containing protein [Candidatus Nanoarchaeia archaeon]
MLSGEEIIDIKQKLVSHIETTFPPEQILSAKSQIESMDSEQLEKFLEKNNILVNDKEEDSKCVFCAIASEKIKSVKIGENEKAIAVLEINPISKGHSIVVPKEHLDEAPKEAMHLAKEISKKIKEKFSPKEVEISESKLFGHAIINILPVYKDENLNSEKQHATIEELEKTKEEFQKEEEKEEEVIPVEEVEKFLWLPKRIP